MMVQPSLEKYSPKFSHIPFLGVNHIKILVLAPTISEYISNTSIAIKGNITYFKSMS